MKKLFISFALLCGIGVSSCSKEHGVEPQQQVKVTNEEPVGSIDLSMQIEVEELEELRSFELTSTAGKPLLSAMQEGQEVEVHLFFSNGNAQTYAKRNFTVKDGRLVLLRGKIDLRGYTNDKDTRDWYVTGYIGGTPASNELSNGRISFVGANTFAHVSNGDKIKLAAPYAFAWKKFKITQLEDEKTNPLLSGIKFKPQGTLIRLKFTYTPTAAPYAYRLKSFRLIPNGVSNSAVVSYAQPVEGSFLTLTPSTSTLGVTNIDGSGIVLTNEQTIGGYWLWVAGGSQGTFKLELTGEPEYPASGRVIKSLLTTTETADISLEGKGSRSPSYNIKFNPERPLLPIEFMAEGDANGDGSEVSGDGFSPGGVYKTNGAMPKPKSNRYAPTDLDFTSVLFSSMSDGSYPSSDLTWYSWSTQNATVVHNYDTQRLDREDYIRILEGYSGGSRLKYSSSLNTKLQAARSARVGYALRLIGDGNKRLSAWRYEYVMNKGIKIEAVYLGPKWEHVADVRQNKGLSHIIQESWWTGQRNRDNVITRYLNLSTTQWYANVINNTGLLGRYATPGAATYKYVEFNAGTQVYKGSTYYSRYLPARRATTYNCYVRYFRVNPYLD